MTVRITWLGHASVMITGSSATIFIDPWKTTRKERADIILLTHDHYDHYSESDINALLGASTRVVAPMSTPLVTDVVAPGESLSVKDIEVRAVPAYNVDKAFHPKANGWVGYVVSLDGKRIYHTGDTDRIPEMKGLSVDAALVPVGGTYTMAAREAADAVNALKPKMAIPIHYGDIVGSLDDAEKFKKLAKIPVEIIPVGTS